MNNMRAEGVGENTAPLMLKGGKPARTSAGSSFNDGTRGSAGVAGFGAGGIAARAIGAGAGAGAGIGVACADGAGAAGGGAAAVIGGAIGAGVAGGVACAIGGAGAGVGAGLGAVTTGVVGSGGASAESGGVRTPRSDHSIQASAAASSTIAAMANAGQRNPPSRRC
jgi:hypothetical protein